MQSKIVDSHTTEGDHEYNEYHEKCETLFFLKKRMMANIKGQQKLN